MSKMITMATKEIEQPPTLVNVVKALQALVDEGHGDLTLFVMTNHFKGVFEKVSVLSFDDNLAFIG